MTRVGIDAQQIAVDIGLWQLAEAEDRKGEDDEGHDARTAHRGQPQMLEAESY